MYGFTVEYMSLTSITSASYWARHYGLNFLVFVLPGNEFPFCFSVFVMLAHAHDTRASYAHSYNSDCTFVWSRRSAVAQLLVDED